MHQSFAKYLLIFGIFFICNCNDKSNRNIAETQISFNWRKFIESNNIVNASVETLKTSSFSAYVPSFKNGKYGLVDESGKTRIEHKYQDIVLDSKYPFYWAKLDGEYFLYTFPNKKIFKNSFEKPVTVKSYGIKSINRNGLPNFYSLKDNPKDDYLEIGSDFIFTRESRNISKSKYKTCWPIDFKGEKVLEAIDKLNFCFVKLGKTKFYILDKKLNSISAGGFNKIENDKIYKHVVYGVNGEDITIVNLIDETVRTVKAKKIICLNDNLNLYMLSRITNGKTTNHIMRNKKVDKIKSSGVYNFHNDKYLVLNTYPDFTLIDLKSLLEMKVARVTSQIDDVIFKDEKFNIYWSTGTVTNLVGDSIEFRKSPIDSSRLEKYLSESNAEQRFYMNTFFSDNLVVLKSKKGLGIIGLNLDWFIPFSDVEIVSKNDRINNHYFEISKQKVEIAINSDKEIIKIKGKKVLELYLLDSIITNNKIEEAVFQFNHIVASSKDKCYVFDLSGKLKYSIEEGKFNEFLVSPSKFKDKLDYIPIMKCELTGVYSSYRNKYFYVDLLTGKTFFEY